ncbi:MAG: polysaccharide deacetylase family protein [Chloroherpetonaceae bacterium]|nr:polysaccharide deacetylase family protein [Chthonomonadaceae bacterium]MDW8208475.1 polysaccharide deacetylase family protein [Chloroherpetonaceae bacterium]
MRSVVALLVLLLTAPAGARMTSLVRAEVALMRLASGDFAEAARACRAGLLEAPDSVILNTLAGAILINTGEASRAEGAFRQALAVAPDDSLALFGRGLAQLAMGNREAALQSFQRSEQKGGDRMHVWIARRYAQWLGGAQIAVSNAGAPDAFVAAQHALEGMAAFRRRDLRRTITELEAAWGALAGNAVLQPGGLLMRFDRSSPLRSAAPRIPADRGPVPPAPQERALSGTIQIVPARTPERAVYAAFECDGHTLGLVNQRPFVYPWDSRTAPNGWHTLTVTLYDAEGTEITRTARRVRTLNPGVDEASDGNAERVQLLRAAIWEALTLRPDRCVCAYTLGAAYRSLGNLPQARRWFLHAAALQPDYRDVRQQLAATGGLSAPMEALWGGLPTERVVALTFDDGPKPGLTETLLRVLRQEQVVATFFVIGRHVSDYPDLARQIVEAGHELANHSYTHSNLTRLSPEVIARELLQTQVAIQSATGRVPRFVRPPGGNWNPKVAQVARDWGLTPCMWTVDVYGSEVVGAQQVADAVLQQVRPGSIILMHNGKMSTLQALPTVIRELKRRGYGFVTVDTMARRLSAARAAEQAAARRAIPVNRRLSE